MPESSGGPTPGPDIDVAAAAPDSVRRFLAGRRIAVAGVARDGKLPANAIFRRLRDEGYDVLAVNPNADTVEGVPAHPSVGAIPGGVDGVVVATHPDVAEDVVRDAAVAGVPRVWFHRSFGTGSVAPGALAACDELGVEAIEGGCPLMFLGTVDPVHACMRWFLQRSGKVPR